MIDFLYKIAAFAVTLGVLVVIHELGHYAVARLLGEGPFQHGLLDGVE